ncbi:heterokaryon incompatibility protein-domain-containing protein [Xylaria palmicola]|nr:heterokaryon incompatibility protein-domain-containing protein [Xylaria palmicola]
MKKAQYQYQPLQYDDIIRILTLAPGQRGDSLRATLEVVPIDYAGSYEAVSYVWADPGLPNTVHEIVIRDGDGNEELLLLRGGSIFAALHQLRLPDRPRRIWADYQQLRFMNRIFQDATGVLVWLGLDTKKEAKSAFNVIHQLDKALGSRSVDGACRDQDTVNLKRLLKDNRESIRALTGLAWFKRGWIVQEIGTGIPATMKWGDAEISWETLASVCERLKSYHHLRTILGITTSDISFLFRRFVEPDENTHHANRFNFVYELQRARHLHFSDDRDRVFVFLGHFSARSRHPLGCGPVLITADYTKTIEKTYIDVAVRILQANPDAAYIVLAAVQHPRKSLPSSCDSAVQTDASLEAWVSDKRRLPSWVPDWRWSESILLAEPICSHRAHGDSTAKLEIIGGNDLVLRVQGVEIDTITALSWPLHSGDFYSKRSPGQPLTAIEWLWREICKKRRFDLSQRYLDGQPAFFAFMQTLSNGCVQAAGHKRRPYNEISDDVWLQKAASYILETLGGSDNISECIRRAAAGVERESHCEKWSRWAASASEGRVFARTGSGYYVLGPAALEAGDIVCVLFGSKVPFCLRPMGGRYLLVGECYVHGLMKGEAVGMFARGEISRKMFDII